MHDLRNSAYKHISVHPEDRNLQVLHFCGRFFIETQLTFGSRSSPDRFDLISDLPLEFALLRSGLKRTSVIKQLDDVVCFGRRGTGTVGRFYKNYRDVCESVGVSLAPETDPEKAFGPRTEGVILGIEFNLKAMTWHMPIAKADRLLALLWGLIHDGLTTIKTLERINGKLTHYCPLVKFGKWERSWILGLQRESGDPLDVVPVSGLAQQQVKWWIRSIQLAKIGSEIQDPRGFSPRIFLAMYPDAAGGNGGEGSGMGSWFMTTKEQPWIQMAWSPLVRDGTKNSLGVSFSSKLTTLEGYAALVGLVSEPDLVRGKTVVVYTDNAGLCYAYAKGHSRCEYVHSICKALNYVAVALDVNLIVEKTPRRSGRGKIVADELSKNNVSKALSLMDDPMKEPSGVPEVLKTWIMDPFPSRVLGEMIMDELSEVTKVLDWGQF